MKSTDSKKKARDLVPVVASGPAAPESTKRKRPSLPCRQDSFFPFARLAWGYCSEHLPAFAADSPRFTLEYIAEQLNLVNTVEAIPGLEIRKASATSARINLIAEAQNMKMQAQKLKTYILFAFSNPQLRNAALKEAGLKYYSKLQNKWSLLSGMAQTATTYMATNQDILTANNNMPVDFPAAFAQATARYKAAWEEFNALGVAVSDGTGELDKGLESLLARLVPMLETGRRIFIFDPVLRRKFTVKDIRNEVQGKHPAGVKGVVKEAGTGLLLADVTVSTTLEGKVKSVKTDLRGRYYLKLPAGTYDILFTAPGMEPHTFEGRKVKPGVQSRLQVALNPAPKADSAPEAASALVSGFDAAVDQLINTTGKVPQHAELNGNGNMELVQ